MTVYKEAEEGRIRQPGTGLKRTYPAATRHLAGARPRDLGCGVAHQLHVDRAAAAGIPGIWLLIEADPLSFDQAIEPVVGHRRTVEEEVATGGGPIGRDESKSLVAQT